MIRKILLVFLVLFGLTFGFGVKFGYSAGLHHQAKPKIITVPEVKIKHDKPDAVTVTVTEPLPDSCIQLMHLLALVQANNAVIDKATGVINAQLVELGTLTALPGITGINSVTSQIIKARDRMDTAHVHNLELWLKVKFLQTECKVR